MVLKDQWTRDQGPIVLHLLQHLLEPWGTVPLSRRRWDGASGTGPLSRGRWDGAEPTAVSVDCQCKPRFGGASGAAAKPNLVARKKPVEPHYGLCEDPASRQPHYGLCEDPASRQPHYGLCEDPASLQPHYGLCEDPASLRPHYGLCEDPASLRPHYGLCEDPASLQPHYGLCEDPASLQPHYGLCEDPASLQPHYGLCEDPACLQPHYGLCEDPASLQPHYGLWEDPACLQPHYGLCEDPASLQPHYGLCEDPASLQPHYGLCEDPASLQPHYGLCEDPASRQPHYGLCEDPACLQPHYGLCEDPASLQPHYGLCEDPASRQPHYGLCEDPASLQPHYGLCEDPASLQPHYGLCEDPACLQPHYGLCEDPASLQPHYGLCEDPASLQPHYGLCEDHHPPFHWPCYGLCDHHSTATEVPRTDLYHLKLWYEPPVPALIYNQAPTPDCFFTHRLLVWMPYHLWQVRVFCPVCRRHLTGNGIHKRARQVLSKPVCIFEWDPADVALLRMAKREQLRQEDVPAITDSPVDRRISKDELALYCRLRTRGEEATIRLIDRLLEQLMGHKGRDLLGVPLLDRERMEHIWRIQKRHVKCIQDLPGVHLYTETGKTTRTQANSLNFQLYLLEGLNRWNQNRAAAATTQKQSAFLSYSRDLVQCVNMHSTKVFGRMFVPSFRPPAQYTASWQCKARKTCNFNSYLVWHTTKAVRMIKSILQFPGPAEPQSPEREKRSRNSPSSSIFLISSPLTR
ncbi:hypothetical protein SKAU_G00321950 [Synaphobranchus kaupii]|uniref:DUF6729 domain-containing protein n=1 Tax=Synaphobranchus kaupii TaxID=118154 RepID=A0A9Q1ENW7_SYNKA|nr:hypothetical protein SKAU_G00321950 [Synaphobranchus kaupii]